MGSENKSPQITLKSERVQRGWDRWSLFICFKANVYSLTQVNVPALIYWLMFTCRSESVGINYSDKQLTNRQAIKINRRKTNNKLRSQRKGYWRDQREREREASARLVLGLALSLCPESHPSKYHIDSPKR